MPQPVQKKRRNSMLLATAHHVCLLLSTAAILPLIHSSGEHPNKMNVQPTALQLAAEDRLRITWSDGQVREYAVRELREKCPCATCREKRDAPPPPTTQLPIVADAQTQPLRITAMKPVGNYAYSIDFSDGHTTGIYTLESLREMGEEVVNG